MLTNLPVMFQSICNRLTIIAAVSIDGIVYTEPEGDWLPPSAASAIDLSHRNYLLFAFLGHCRSAQDLV